MGGLATSPRRTDDTKPTHERKNVHETEPRNAWCSRTHGPSAEHESYRTPPRGGHENDSRLSCPEGLSRPFVFARRASTPHSVCHNAAFSVSRGCFSPPRPTCDLFEFHLQLEQVPTGKRRGARRNETAALLSQTCRSARAGARQHAECRARTTSRPWQRPSPVLHGRQTRGAHCPSPRRPSRQVPCGRHAPRAH